MITFSGHLDTDIIIFTEPGCDILIIFYTLIVLSSYSTSLSLLS